MESSRVRRFVAEGIGTFALVAIGPGAIMVAAKTGAFGHAAVALAFGLAVTPVVASSGRLGGAHINAAVTSGFWSLRRFPGRDVFLTSRHSASAPSAPLHYSSGYSDLPATMARPFRHFRSLNRSLSNSVTRRSSAS